MRQRWGKRALRDAISQLARGDKSRKTNRGSLPAHLQWLEQVVDVEDKACPCGGGALHAIGEDVAERPDVAPTPPVSWWRVDHAMAAGPAKHGRQAPAPDRIVEGGIPTEALIAQVLVAKYADHLLL